MKYVVELALKYREMPADYRRIFISFFKKAISNYMEGYFYEELYDSGAVQKELVWSVRFDAPSFQNGRMLLGGNRVIMTMKIPDQKTALVYYSSLLGMKGKEFLLERENALVLQSIRMVREPSVEGGIATFKILSPICLRDHEREGNHDTYYSVGDEGFVGKFRESLRKELPHLEREIAEMEVEVSGMKKVIVPAFRLKIPATIGVFSLKADDRVLNYVATCGVGSRRNAGFGLVEYVG